jgi:hypothetical protein
MRRGSRKQRKNTRYPLNTRLGGPQSRSRSFAEEKKLLPQPRWEPRADRAKLKHVLMRCGSRKQRKNTRYPLNTVLGRPQSRSRSFAEEKNLLHQPRLEPRADRAKLKHVLMRYGSRK